MVGVRRGWLEMLGNCETLFAAQCCLKASCDRGRIYRRLQVMNEPVKPIPMDFGH